MSGRVRPFQAARPPFFRIQKNYKFIAVLIYLVAVWILIILLLSGCNSTCYYNPDYSLEDARMKAKDLGKFTKNYNEDFRWWMYRYGFKRLKESELPADIKKELILTQKGFVCVTGE